MHTRVLLFLVLFAFFSCEKKEDPMLPEPPAFKAALTLKKCTGLNFTDANGQSIGMVGNPNVKTGRSFPYPNPAGGVLSVFTQDDVSEIYFVRAEKDTSFKQTDFAALFQQNLFNLDSIKEQKTANMAMLSGSMNYNFNISDFEAGYYRLFFRLTNDSVYCDNVFIDPNAFPNESYTWLISDWK